MVDFETALMNGISVFSDVLLKGCCSHYSQAIRRKTFLIGVKTNYLNVFKFKFWVKRFIALALIPIDKLKDAMDIIIQKIPSTDDKLIIFITYFNNQWLNGFISPEIWNHRYSQKRTNNNVEGFHSKLTKIIPKYHSKFSEMVNCIKNVMQKQEMDI